MTRDQKIVAAGAASGVASMALAMWVLSAMLLAVPAGLETVSERLAYALRWEALAALPLVLMIGAVGNARALSDAIDPTRGAEDAKMVIDGRVADNTMQQYLLFLAGSLGLAASLPTARMPVIGAAAIVVRPYVAGGAIRAAAAHLVVGGVELAVGLELTRRHGRRIALGETKRGTRPAPPDQSSRCISASNR